MIKKNSFRSKYSEFLQTTLTAETRLAGGQILLDRQTLHMELSFMYPLGGLAILKAEGMNLDPR
jgi:hypothetical protein